jgi:hypothetical protein
MVVSQKQCNFLMQMFDASKPKRLVLLYAVKHLVTINSTGSDKSIGNSSKRST